MGHENLSFSIGKTPEKVENLSYSIGKTPEKVLGPKFFLGPVRKPLKSDRRKIYVPRNLDFSTFS